MKEIRDPPKTPIVLEELFDEEHLFEHILEFVSMIERAWLAPPGRLLKVGTSIASPSVALLGNGVEL